ncbi:magnesium protoporphyrin IX methyltransferase [Tropicimonas sp. IMCC34043]|uniref:magnesium protoporphyrin IX methyltransferase n=1 Tax=Tropicimonas sp. IMCC34043 TaxID=2248760 RepID=UPI000E221A76|nr:magnesium protoporphyrin IX methyltransferase [Tropicimonas sp. IMCC34043]
MSETYKTTRAEVQTYFDQIASTTWEQLTSDAPVSRIRQTVREGRDTMRRLLLDALPADLTGARVFDAGCGTGQAANELAARGAEVLAVDISPSLLHVARRRTAPALASRIDFRAGDMLDPDFGRFDHVIAMDSLIHYRPEDSARALSALRERTRGKLVFTVAPKTPLLTLMHWSGKVLPRSNRSPAIVPASFRRLSGELAAHGWSLHRLGRVQRGFYISDAMELRP